MNKPILKNSKLGSTIIGGGVVFKVWAPNADSVSVTGNFNDWDASRHPLTPCDDGTWHLFVPKVKAGDEYKYEIINGDQRLLRIDPYAREVTNSVGNSVVYDTQAFQWEDDDFQLANFNELVIYELHVGTFNRTKENSVGTFNGLIKNVNSRAIILGATTRLICSPSNRLTVDPTRSNGWSKRLMNTELPSSWTSSTTISGQAISISGGSTDGAKMVKVESISTTTGEVARRGENRAPITDAVKFALSFTIMR